jgi:hypothetical protein
MNFLSICVALLGVLCRIDSFLETVQDEVNYKPIPLPLNLGSKTPYAPMQHPSTYSKVPAECSAVRSLFAFYGRSLHSTVEATYHCLAGSPESGIAAWRTQSWL